MFDFTKAQVRCSGIHSIMSGTSAKTNIQKWEELCAEIAEKELRRDNMKKKDGAGYAKLIDTIDRLEDCKRVLDRVKNEPLPLSDTCKNYLSALYAGIKYGKWNPVKDIGNKFTAKGKSAELESIKLTSILDGVPYSKNELHLENEWLTGTPDIIVGDDPYNAEKIIDVKTPWDTETFFSNLNSDQVNPQYYWQMQGYMALSNAKVAEVHFCLVNIPDDMLNTEKIRLFNRSGFMFDTDPEYKKSEEQLVKNLTFDDMPIYERRIKFVVERNEEDIKKVYNQVEKCRPHLQEIEKRHIFGVNYVTLEGKSGESKENSTENNT